METRDEEGKKERDKGHDGSGGESKSVGKKTKVGVLFIDQTLSPSLERRIVHHS